MRLIIEILGILMIIGTLLPFIRTTNRFVRMLDFPRLQIASFLLLLWIAYFIFWYNQQAFSLVWMGFTGLAFLIQSAKIFPFTVFAPIQAIRFKGQQPAHPFNMMIANVRMENAHKDKFVRLVGEANPDILLVNEPDAAWASALKVLEKTYPYSVQNPLPNTYGMMLFSRLPLRQSQVLYRVEEGIPSIFTEVQLPSGKKFNFYCLHPQPPTHSNDTEKREAELLLVGKEIKKRSQPAIIAGDLNDVGWSHTTNLFKKVSGMIDPRIGRGFFNTYSVFVPGFRYPLDHIFYTPHFQLVDMQRLPAFGSDHFPILISLCFAPEKQQQQPAEHADQEEHQEANELISEGLAAEPNANN
jgi:endonuclease/exonuclease/phosphatase (EEP) superfamily protein YafD